MIGPWNPEKEQRLFGLNKKESHKDGWSGDLTEIQMDEMVEKWNEDISKLQNMTSSNRMTSSCSSGNRSPNVSSQNTTPFSSSQTSNRDVRDVRDVQVGLNRIFAQRGRQESGAPPNATIHSNTVSIRNPASRATTDLEALESSIALELRNLMSTMSGSGHPNRDELQVTFRDLLRSTNIGRVLTHRNESWEPQVSTVNLEGGVYHVTNIFEIITRNSKLLIFGEKLITCFSR